MAATPAALVQFTEPQFLCSETWIVAWDTFSANKVRFLLTALGMVIGTASLILVVTIGLAGKEYVEEQIQSIGSNLIYASYEAAGNTALQTTRADFLTVGDMKAVEEQVAGIRAASPMAEYHIQLVMPEGKTRDILVLGVAAEYSAVRNLEIVDGRFFDQEDTRQRNKVAVIRDKLAAALYGTPDAAVGETIKLATLPFTVIGTFRERVETFGQSEISEDTVLVPYAVSRYFSGSDNVKDLFFTVADSADVPHATIQIRQVIQSRHRAESQYDVENLTQLLAVARKTADTLTLVLLLISAITLLVSGIGIMNIMLATVSARIREIGIRKAVGATRQAIRLQFLAEAVFIALLGGITGVVIGLAAPVTIRLFTVVDIPISAWSVFVALFVSSLVGILFGTLPATRAANLDPVESLRQE